jgi:hypothetical protein
MNFKGLTIMNHPRSTLVLMPNHRELALHTHLLRYLFPVILSSYLQALPIIASERKQTLRFHIQIKVL